MENRIARLEARLEAVEKELKALKGKMGLEPSKPKTENLSQDEEIFLDACSGAAGNGGSIQIRELRTSLGWSPERFDNVLDMLAKNGRVILQESSGMGLSLKQMDDSFWGDDGRSYTEISLA